MSNPLEPYVGAVVCWVYDEPHVRYKGRTTAAVVVEVLSEAEGRVNLHAYRLDCGGTFIVKDVQYDGQLKENGTWHWPKG